MASAQPFPIPPQGKKKTNSSRNKDSRAQASASKGRRKKDPELDLYPMQIGSSTRRNRNGGKMVLESPRQENSAPRVRNLKKNSELGQLSPTKTPLWLQGLMSLHFISSCITFVLIGGALGVYGWTVYTQQSWGRAYRYLETLQRNERQLTATNETIKNDLALEAENPQMGLVNPDPNTTIFLTPADDQLKAPHSIASDEQTEVPSGVNPSHIPLGY